jgi:hypothetical protein
MTTAAVATTTTETAYAWWQRARAQQPMLAPTHPAAAARAFGQQLATGGWGGDCPTTSSRRRRRLPVGQPLVQVTGPVVATTATLVTLAVRYVVQTRPSLFDGQRSTTTGSTSAAMLPQVFLMDASWEISVPQIRRILRATLLRDYDAAAVDGAASPPPPDDQADHDVRLARDTECCLSRIHMAHADAVDTLPLVASSLATHVATHSRSHPTLVLWNTTANEDEDDPQEPAARREVQRQFLRLADQYEFLLVVAVATFSGPSSTWPPLQATRPKGVWDDRVTQRIRLAAAPPGAAHAYTAQTFGSSGETPAVLPVSLTAVGVRFG